MMTHKQHLKRGKKYIGCKECLKDDPLFTICHICDKPIINSMDNIVAHQYYHISGKINNKGEIIKE